MVCKWNHSTIETFRKIPKNDIRLFYFSTFRGPFLFFSTLGGTDGFPVRENSFAICFGRALRFTEVRWLLRNHGSKNLLALRGAGFSKRGERDC